MTNRMIEGISRALYEEFGYENHMEEMKQDFEEPCFFIQCLNPSCKRCLGYRYHRRNTFCIQYFPKSKGDGRRECNEVAERMLGCLEYVELDGMVRGTGMRYEVVDGVLNFFVDYNYFVYRAAVQETEMDSLHSEIAEKGSGAVGN